MKSNPPPPSPSLAAVALAALTALFAAPHLPAQEQGRYTLIFGGQIYTIPYESAGGIDYLPLPTLAEIFRAPMQRDPMSGDPALSVGRVRVGVSLRQPIASIDNRVVPLDGTARQKEGVVWVSADFVAEAMAPALGEQAKLDAGRKRIEMGGERPLRVVMRSTSGDGGTRLTFELSRKAPYSLRQSGRKLYLTLDTPSLDAPFQLEDLDTATVRRVKLLRSESEKGFVIELGREFSTYDLIEGASPPALVVELRRAGHESQPLAQAPSAADAGTGLAPGASPGAAARPPSAALPPAALPRESRRGDGRPVIVIDPGHGGDEKGATGPGGLFEKDVTLDVAQRLKTRLERAGNARVILTRDDDRAVSLSDRTAFANHEGAELFVSIHANAARKQDAHGAETYFLSYQATDAEAQAVAALENAQDAGGAAAPERPDLRMVLWDLAQAEHLRESSALAETVQAELNSLLGLRDRGVKQAPFRVLMSATMPSILIEIGFITNPDEEEKLRSPAYRESLALAIAQSVQRFREDLGARAAGAGRPRTTP
jgi:N-acetylmuramoyl-L-alanine amidase